MGIPKNTSADRVYIPRFSPMENGTTVYDVTYKDGVTVISRKDTMQHLVSSHEMGATFLTLPPARLPHWNPET